MSLIDQLLQISWNIIFGIAILFVIHFVLKRWIKRFMMETLKEYEKHKAMQDAMARTQHVRNKYG